MPPSSDPTAAALPLWLRALWGLPARASRVQASGTGDAVLPRPVLSGRAPGERVLHLPAVPPSGIAQWAAAAGAHAAAHWRFGGAPQARQGFKPIQLALFGALEDARVEALALRELPGLRELWLPFHEADRPEGGHFAALLARLSHALLDPGRVDGHPWVTRVQHLVQSRLADIAPSELRTLASVLGNEVGQMRLGFDITSYRVHAAYRDDHHFLWEEDSSLPPSPHALEAETAQGALAQADARTAPPAEAARIAFHAEWDHQIGRLRPGWVRVMDRQAPTDTGAQLEDAGLEHRARALAAALRAKVRARRASAGRSAWGDVLHHSALVDAAVQWRARQTVDDRLYCRLHEQGPASRVLLLVDASASMGVASVQGPSLLRAVASLALGVCDALEASGDRCAIVGFRSDGRHQVDFLHLKGWDERAAQAQVRQRIASLRPAGSTRTGAAVRHAASLLAQAQAGTRRGRIVLFSDGQPHDVDVPRAHYLVHDLQHALREARRLGIGVTSVPVTATSGMAAVRGSLAGVLGP